MSAAISERFQPSATLNESPFMLLSLFSSEKTEAENLQIVQLVRSMRLTPQELNAMISGGGIPGMEAAPGYPAEPADHDTEEMEDTENE